MVGFGFGEMLGDRTVKADSAAWAKEEWACGTSSSVSSCDWIIDDISTYQPRAGWCVCVCVNQGGLSGRADAHSAWGMGVLAEWGLW